MEETDKPLNKSPNYVLPVFIGMGVGALVGLVAYVKDWLWFVKVMIWIYLKNAQLLGNLFQWFPSYFIDYQHNVIN